jgi:hypothetical protein
MTRDFCNLIMYQKDLEDTSKGFLVNDTLIVEGEIMESNVKN